ncbi:MAG: patatin family protein [Eubacterium sp.]
MYRSGLVLEGGGTRAIYSSGVLDAFIEKDITFPYVIGVSAGTCNGASFLGKSLHRQHDITINYSGDKRYMSLSNMLKTGEYLGSEWIFNELCYDISPLDQDAFDKSNSVFCCVVTNAKTGKAEYLYPDSLRPRGCPEIRASCSLPIATKGCEIGGELYFDGGLVDSIPLKRALNDGCQKAVIILTQHKGYIKQPMNPKLKKVFKKYPKIGEAVVNRHIMYNNQLAYVKEMQEQGLAYVIQPTVPLDCGTLEKSKAKLESIYQLGYRQGLKAIDEVIDFIG